MLTIMTDTAIEHVERNAVAEQELTPYIPSGLPLEGPEHVVLEI
jgi:hypothetical protein